MNKRKYELIEELKRLGWDCIPKRENDEFYPECRWWNVNRGHLSYSVYHDPKDYLGRFGRPYYEILENIDTYRFADHDKEFLEWFEGRYKKYQKRLNTNPELYL